MRQNESEGTTRNNPAVGFIKFAFIYLRQHTHINYEYIQQTTNVKQHKMQIFDVEKLQNTFTSIFIYRIIELYECYVGTV